MPCHTKMLSRNSHERLISLYCWFILTRIILVSGFKFKNTSVALDMQGKIVGGKPVSIEQFPSSVIVYNMGFQCSGTIITNYAVLTAAHCFMINDDPYNMVIQVGSRYPNDANADMYTVEYVKIHKDYNQKQQFSNDIAVMFVKRPIRFSKKAKKAVIVSHNKWMAEKERNFSVTGWGMIKYAQEGAKFTLSDSLLMASLRFIDNKQCGQMHNIVLDKGMFCLYGDAKKDSCKGDSGGGVMWKNMLVGIVSHGDGCAQKNKPSIYTNVWYFTSWIKMKLDYFYGKYYCQNMRSRPEIMRDIKDWHIHGY